jgi:hypothetical protein
LSGIVRPVSALGVMHKTTFAPREVIKKQSGKSSLCAGTAQHPDLALLAPNRQNRAVRADDYLVRRGDGQVRRCARYALFWLCAEND